mgnify:CR=1 FL=1
MPAIYFITALFMAGITSDASPEDTQRWPDLVLFLGDQVYADETSEQMQEFIASRRSLDEPPGEELKDFEEYSHLYWLAWTDPLNRWLLSTLRRALGAGSVRELAAHLLVCSR